MTIEEKMLEVIKKIAKAEKEYKKAINQIAAYEFEQKNRKLTEELVGLYDALESRTAVQVVKTMEERINDYVQRYDEYDRGICRDVAERAYIQGATDQRKIDINKACKWLYKNQKNYDYINLDGDVYDLSLIEDFKKAMEE